MSEEGSPRHRFLGSSAWAISRMFHVHPRLAVAQTCLVLLDSLGPAVQVLCIGRLITAVSSSGGRATPDVVLWIIVTALSVGLNGTIRDATLTVGQIVSRIVGADAQGRLAYAMSALPPSAVSDAALTTRARAARDAIGSHVAQHGTYSLNSLRAIVTMALIVVSLWRFNPASAVLIGLASVPVIFAFSRVARIEADLWPVMSQESKFANYFSDQLVYERTATELAALGTGGRIAGLAASRYRAGARVFAQMMFRSSLRIAAAGILSTVMLLAALSLLALGPTASAGAVAGGVVAVMAGMAATSDAGYTFGGVIAGTPAVEIYRRFTEGRERPGTAGAAQHDGLLAGDLRGDALTFTYPGTTRPALDVDSFVARPGQMIGIVGANGAGKTTLVQTLTGFRQPDSGHVAVGDQRVSEMSEAQRLLSFGQLSQEFGRYELTVREAVLLGTARQDVTDEEVWAALAAARAADFVRAFPGGLDEQLGQQWGGVGLSGGQWQRLALARIAVRDAPIWILDEPTSAVDAETEAQFFHDLGEQREARITVVVSHRAWTLQDMDLIYVMEAGRVVQVGTFQELRGDPAGPFGRMFASQFSQTADETQVPDKGD